MVQLKSLKCPECGSVLTIPENVTDYYQCPYCGTQVFMSADGERVIHHIDEAGIRYVEAEERVQIQERQLENRKRKAKKNVQECKNKSIGLWFGAVLVLGVLMIDTLEKNRAFSMACFVAVGTILILGIPFMIIGLLKK